ncbi:MAG: DUF2723 domain-containing protein [Gemmatimonas sp.]|nr:DUF2723 domain-containing protein [Gemmatimonas sp.]
MREGAPNSKIMEATLTEARPAQSAEAQYSSIPYGAALLAGCGVLALYAISLAPSTAFWDTSEYIATAQILGIPHPPGNPLFVLMARAWELVLAPTGLSVPVRINLFSAFMSAGAAVFWFLIVYRILSSFTENEIVRRVGSGASVLLSATAFTVWNQSNVNEKVYTLSLFTIALLSWLAFLWRDQVEEHRGLSPRLNWHDDNVLVLAMYVLALSVGNHLMAFLAAPALLVLLLMVKPRALANWRLYLWALVFAFIGLSVHLYLPIRAELAPIINEANPTCASLGEAVVSILTFGAAGCEELSAALAREQYAKPPVTDRLAPFWAQILNYVQYFDWQWSRSLMGTQGWLAPARLPFTLLFVGLGGFGAWRHWQRDRISFTYIATLFATLSLGLLFYLNFRYGYSQVGAYGLPFEQGEVRERDYFFIVSFSLWGLWSGIGLTALWLEASDRLGPGRRGLMRGGLVMLLALLPLVLNWSYASRAGDYAARDWAFNLLNSVEPYGILFTNGDNDTFPLWYLQEVEGVRQDVTVAVWSYLNTPWYAKQLRDLTRPCNQPGEAEQDPTRITCQREFRPDGAASVYEAGAPYPSDTALPLTDEEIDAVTGFGYTQLPQDVIFEARGIQVPLAAGTTLPAADQFILSMIRNSWGDRPIYFAMTTNAHRNLGLQEHVARQGLAFKLLSPPEKEHPDLVPMPPDGPYAEVFGAYVDVPRTRQLLGEEFVYRDITGFSRWPDDSTRGIPTYYGYAHLALSQAEQALGNEEAAQRNLERAEEWFALAER